MRIHPQTKLKKWILKVGIKRFAHRLNLDLSTVYRWLDGSRYPAPRFVQEIVRVSKGRVSVEDVFDHWVTANEARTARGTN